MRHERTVVAADQRDPCLNRYCPRDAVSGQHGYCSPCGQAVRRRIKAGDYTKEELVARGKLLRSPIDSWLAS
jgi:hypothetical protein